MCVVAPGKQPKTQTEKVLSTSSGHVIHLMPGDHLYDPAAFQIVIVWNGLNHYIPSYLIHHSSVLQYRCSVISKLLNNATDLFGEIESDLDDCKDEELIEQFHCLRDTAVIASQMLAIRGMESSGKLPSSTTGPDPRDTKGHLTRKTPLPVHPQPLIRFALSHNLNPDSAVKRDNPTPSMPLPSPSKLNTQDFNIEPSDYETDSVRCIKTAGQKAPGKMIPTRQQLLVSIPFPLNPTKGHPPAKPDSIGAKRFKKGYVEPAGQSELVEIVQQTPVESIPYAPERIACATEPKQELAKKELTEADQKGNNVLPGSAHRIPQSVDKQGVSSEAAHAGTVDDKSRITYQSSSRHQIA